MKKGWKFIELKIEEMTNFCRKQKNSFDSNVRLIYEEINCSKVHPIKVMKSRRGIRDTALLFL
jgi:DUF438 domain-containing protein